MKGSSSAVIFCYSPNGAAANPQKEYGYRNGELLVTATVTSGWGAAPVIDDNPLKNPDNPETGLLFFTVLQNFISLADNRSVTDQNRKNRRPDPGDSFRKDRVAAAIAKAEAAFADPAFMNKLTNTVSRGVTHFGKGSAAARAKSGELRFLLKILRKGK